VLIRYLRALFGTALGRALFIAGFISTAMTYVSVYVPQYHLPRWILIAIAVAAFLFAPVRLYIEQEKRIAELDARVAQPRRAQLILKAEGVGFYLRIVEAHTRTKPIALYLEPRISIENKGTRNSAIESFDLRFPDLPELQAQSNVRPQRFRESDFVPAMIANHSLGGGDDYVRGYFDVPAERLVGPLRIPFVIEGALPSQLYESGRNLNCELTVRDTEGNTATTLVPLHQRG
jgi:hypothetical protein